MARSTTLAERLTALDRVVAVGRGRMPAEELAAAEAVARRARERLARGDDVVVAALAGGTGSGKSALFNAVAGETLSAVGARRPVTTAAAALVTGNGGATAVLDWLGVARRHHRPEGGAVPHGLVLLDLPDHDSVAVHHRLVVDHLVARVDLMVWVLDPVKYAQRTVHADYLRQLAAHADVVLVVLNKVDTLTPDERRACLDDLRRILDGEGLRAARLLAVSAVTGAGVDELRTVLAAETRARRAVAERIAADVRTVAARLREHAGDPSATTVETAGLVDTLASAAGVEAIADLAGRSAAAVTHRRTRPLVWRGARAVTAPLTALRGALHAPARRRLPAGDEQDALTRGREPSPIAVRHALLGVVDDAGAALPAGWQRRLRSLAGELSDDVPRIVGRAVDGVSLRPPGRRWWAVLAVVWSLVELVALVGVGWLTVLAALTWLQLPLPDVPSLTPRLPWPTALALGGALAWVAVGLLRNRLAAVGARRHRRRMLRRLRQAVGEAAETSIVAPLRRELAAHDELVAALDIAAR